MASEKIADHLGSDRIHLNVSATSKPEILRELLEVFKAVEVVSDVDAALEEFLEREAKGSTGIGNGIAIPHIRSDQVGELEYLFANSPEGVDFESLDGNPIHILFMMMAPKSSQGAHIRALAKVSRILNDETVRFRLGRAETREEVLRILTEREEEIG